MTVINVLADNWARLETCSCSTLEQVPSDQMCYTFSRRWPGSQNLVSHFRSLMSQSVLPLSSLSLPVSLGSFEGANWLFYRVVMRARLSLALGWITFIRNHDFIIAFSCLSLHFCYGINTIIIQQDLDLIDLRLTWMEMENLIFGDLWSFLENFSKLLKIWW